MTTSPSAPDHSQHGHHHDHRHGVGIVAHGHSDQHGQEHRHRRRVRGATGSLLRPHSHDAADTVDAALTASDEGMRALKISLAALALTAVVQGAVVAVSGSVALLADAIHNFADALTAVPLAVAFWLGRRQPSRRYTYGYGRAEDLAGVVIIATITTSAAIAAWEAIDRLVRPHPEHQLGWVVAAGVVGFLGNEIVARYRIRTGRCIGSAALEADGYHARVDGFTSLAVILGATGVALGWRLADPIIGLAITVAILAVIKNAARDIYRRLLDAVDPALVDHVTAVLADVDGIRAVDTVRVRWVGHELHAEAEVVSDGALTLGEAHQVGERAHHRLLHEIPRLAQATIHTSPATADGENPHALTAHHRRRTPPEDTSHARRPGPQPQGPSPAAAG